MAKCYDILLRLLLLGDTGVGKSCILCRYVNDEFLDTHISTIGIDFKMRTINLDKKIAKIQIWDTAGQERFEAITHQFYRRAQGVLLVYDLCSRTSFENLTKWISYVDEISTTDLGYFCTAESGNGIHFSSSGNEAKAPRMKNWNSLLGADKFANEDIELLLVANKSDRSQWRQVSCEEGKMFADRYNMKFFETSAKNRENIDQISEFLSIKLHKKRQIQDGDAQLVSEMSGKSEKAICLIAFRDLCECIIDKQTIKRQKQYIDPNPNLVYRGRNKTLSLSTPEMPGDANKETSWSCCASLV